MNKIINIKTITKNNKNASSVLNELYQDWIYVGRENKTYGLIASPLANPFVIGELTREEVISKYRVWLWSKIKEEDSEVLAELKKITSDTVLVCWCYPQICHAKIISKAAKWLRSK